MSFVLYITQERDRWDLIAARHYGDPFGYERIIAANPTVPIVPVLPAGIRLAVPVVPRTVARGSQGLPPWKVPS